ncbi:hypothetical protein [Pseudomonas sp. MPDS]|nr:hypothetical protein [Pseudomonas sp. MPDS]
MRSQRFTTKLDQLWVV